VFSIVGRAASRNIRYPDIALGYAAAGPQTKMYFYEAAAVNLSCVTSGYGAVQTVHPAKAIMDDGVTPTEAQFCTEMVRNVTGMKADQANELVNLLLEKYEGRVDNAPQGKRYQDCYDLRTDKPTDDYQRMYEEVRDELTSLGIALQ
jgi:methylamine--corrinoid protein Co-methyltransferase